MVWIFQDGHLVSTAAGVPTAGFFAFGTASASVRQMFGAGCGLTILLEALLIRGILVPASMRLPGRHAWSAPDALRRLHHRVGLTDSESGSGSGSDPVPPDLQPVR